MWACRRDTRRWYHDGVAMPRDHRCPLGPDRCPVLRTGCPWRQRPADFPPWQTVYQYFARWERQQRDRDGHAGTVGTGKLAAAPREADPSAGLLDSQSVKLAVAGAREMPNRVPSRVLSPPSRHQTSKAAPGQSSPAPHESKGRQQQRELPAITRSRNVPVRCLASAAFMTHSQCNVQ